MEILKNLYGRLPGSKEVDLYTLRNNRGMEVDITNYGGIITAIRIPDKNLEPGDVVLGFDSLDKYLQEHPYFGAIIGRFCNRIAGGRFELDGREYKLAVNNGPNHLHGGIRGFDKVLWTASQKKTHDELSLTLAYVSADMEEGYPGNLLVEVDYSLNDENALMISYRAKTDKTTHVNLTNHSYFNLNNCRGTIRQHMLMIDADHVTLLDENSIPTGEIAHVGGGPFDFREAKMIGEDIEAVDPGYDINYVLNDYNGELNRIAALQDQATGRSMEIYTTEPGVQLYTANYVDDILGKQGVKYGIHSAVCLETQHFPDSPNKANFPSTRLEPGEEFRSATVYKFKW